MLKKILIAGLAFAWCIVGSAAGQTKERALAETPLRPYPSDEAAALNKKALADALKRTNGDLPRALAYMNGGESGLRAFDTKPNTKPKTANDRKFATEFR